MLRSAILMAALVVTSVAAAAPGGPDPTRRTPSPGPAPAFRPKLSCDVREGAPEPMRISIFNVGNGPAAAGKVIAWSLTAGGVASGTVTLSQPLLPNSFVSTGQAGLPAKGTCEAHFQ